MKRLNILVTGWVSEWVSEWHMTPVLQFVKPQQQQQQQQRRQEQQSLHIA